MEIKAVSHLDLCNILLQHWPLLFTNNHHRNASQATSISITSASAQIPIPHKSNHPSHDLPLLHLLQSNSTLTTLHHWNLFEVEFAQMTVQLEEGS